MSASNEWWEYHLTKEGWIQGSEKLDFGSEKVVPEPPGTLLTRTYKQYMSSSFSPLEKTYSDSGEKTPEVLELLKKYPHPHKYYESYSNY
jgi:hypothetical protein